MTPQQRVLNLEAGVVMAVTDLHGDWEAYCRYRDKFLSLYAHGQADYFLLMGDLIHRSSPPQQDGSLQMVLDVLALRQKLGDRLIYLLGNHEVPHIYSFTLQKGEEMFTPRFELAMGQHRTQIVTLFDSLPFYVRTKAGVTLCHAGAAPELTAPKGLQKLFNWSHGRILQETAAQIREEERPSLRRAMTKRNHIPYDQMVYNYFGITSPDHPRYDDFLIGTFAANAHPDFEILWSALFTKCEQQYGPTYYNLILSNSLVSLSADYYPQHVLASGHIDCIGGYKVIANQQLRFASGKHAQPASSARYLLFDTEKEIKTAEFLLSRLNKLTR